MFHVYLYSFQAILDVGSILRFCNEVPFCLDFSQNMQKLNKVGFMNSILILRVVMIINGTLVEKCLNLSSSTSPSYATTMRELVQSSRVMPKIFISPHTPS